MISNDVHCPLPCLRVPTSDDATINLTELYTLLFLTKLKKQDNATKNPTAKSYNTKILPNESFPKSI